MAEDSATKTRKESEAKSVIAKDKVTKREKEIEGSEETISVSEAGKRLGVSPRAVRFRIERGELNAVKKGGAWLIVWPGGAKAQSVKNLGPQTLRPKTGVHLQTAARFAL